VSESHLPKKRTDVEAMTPEDAGSSAFTSPTAQGTSFTGDRISSLMAAQGWIVIFTDDYAAFREWERLENQFRNRMGDIAELKKAMAKFHDQVMIEILAVLAWAVRSRPGDADEVVPIVAWQSRLGPPDDIVANRQMIRMASDRFLDEDERRFLVRDGMVRRKLSWYQDRIQE
jgi:hypothetical protein